MEKLFTINGWEHSQNPLKGLILIFINLLGHKNDFSKVCNIFVKVAPQWIMTQLPSPPWHLRTTSENNSEVSALQILGSPASEEMNHLKMDEAPWCYKWMGPIPQKSAQKKGEENIFVCTSPNDQLMAWGSSARTKRTRTARRSLVVRSVTFDEDEDDNFKAFWSIWW